jgi:hypothetical protein
LALASVDPQMSIDIEMKGIDSFSPSVGQSGQQLIYQVDISRYFVQSYINSKILKRNKCVIKSNIIELLPVGILW